MSGDVDDATQRLRDDYAASVDNRLQAAALGILALAAALYPLLLDWLTTSLGTRTVSIAIAVLGFAGMLRAEDWTRRLAQLAAALLATSAAVTGAILPMLLLPAVIYGALAAVFLASAREEQSIVERVAMAIQPFAPDFIGPYCRWTSVLWGSVFLVNAVVLLVAALAASQATWRSVAGVWIWSWMGAVTVVEFLARKTYFRNYFYMGPFEQVWSRLFPSDATAMGRRSAEHIRRTREKLGLK